jgi:hypothetical protein
MRITILHDVSAAPDHVHVRLYKAGEEFEIGHSLMPQGLADALCAGGYFQPVKGFQMTGTEDIQSVPKEEVPSAKMDDKPLGREWKEIVHQETDKNGIVHKYTKHDIMHVETFGIGGVVLPW